MFSGAWQREKGSIPTHISFIQLLFFGGIKLVLIINLCSMESWSKKEVDALLIDFYRD